MGVSTYDECRGKVPTSYLLCCEKARLQYHVSPLLAIRMNIIFLLVLNNITLIQYSREERKDEYNHGVSFFTGARQQQRLQHQPSWS